MLFRPFHLFPINKIQGLSKNMHSQSPRAKSPLTIGKLVKKDCSPIHADISLQTDNPEDSHHPITSIFNIKQVGEIVEPVTHTKLPPRQDQESESKNEPIRYAWKLQQPTGLSKIRANAVGTILSRHRLHVNSRIGSFYRTPPKQSQTQTSNNNDEVSDRSLPQIQTTSSIMASTPNGYFQIKKRHTNSNLQTKFQQNRYEKSFEQLKRANGSEIVPDSHRDEKLFNKSATANMFRVSKNRGLKGVSFAEKSKSRRDEPESNRSLLDIKEAVKNSSLHSKREVEKPNKQSEQEQQQRQQTLARQHKQRLDEQIQVNFNPATIANQNSKSEMINSNSFIRLPPSASNIQPEQLLIIDLRISISKIKQTLIQSGDTLFISFRIPEVLFRPPSPTTSSTQLLQLMKQMFEHVGISPQIVTIKKYANCVMMRDRRLCILWYFTGKIYFGEYLHDQEPSGDQNGMEKVIKSGVGLEWHPSHQIYYGEFHNNKKQGYGVLKKSNKQSYIGCWHANNKQGWGKLYNGEGALLQNGQYEQGVLIS